MLEIAKAYFRRWVVTDSVEKELYYILILLRLLLVLCVVLITIWGSIAIINDIRTLLYSYGTHTTHVELNSTMLFKSILIATLGFFLPRILWQIMPLSPVLDRILRGRTEEAIPGRFPVAQDFIPSSVDPITHCANSYRRSLADVAKWLSSQREQLGLKQDTITKHVGTFESRLDFTQAVLKEHKQNKHLNVFLFGQKTSGKTSLISALLGREVEPKTVYCGLKGMIITELEAKVEDLLMRFYEVPGFDAIVPAAKEDTLDAFIRKESPVIQLAVDFIIKHRTLPDICVLVSKSKEMHTTQVRDMKYLQAILYRINKYCVFPLSFQLLHVVSHCDEVYPSDLKHPDEYDDEKLGTIAQLAKLSKDSFVEFNKNAQLSSSAGSWFPLNHIATLPAACKFIMKDGLIESSRDYRYNLQAIAQHLKQSAVTLQTLPSHVFFVLHLSELFTQLAGIISGTDEVQLASKYMIEVYLVTSISSEWTPKTAPSTKESDSLDIDPSDPVQFAKCIKEFWLTLGLTNMALHSMKAVSEQIVKQIPALGHVVLESVEAASGIKFGLEELTMRLGQAALAFFVEQRGRLTVSKVFEGKFIY